MERTKPKCLICGEALPRKIRQTGLHAVDCPWNYHITCQVCKYQNNLSKLLGFWFGCSERCMEESIQLGPIHEVNAL